MAGRAQAGGTNTACVQGHCARARVGGARTFRLDLGLLARRQRQDVVDPGGLEVRGRGECPDPAAGYPAGGWAELASAPSPAPASSCTAIVSFSRGQAIYGVPDASVDRARARRRTDTGCQARSCGTPSLSTAGTARVIGAASAVGCLFCVCKKTRAE